MSEVSGPVQRSATVGVEGKGSGFFRMLEDVFVWSSLRKGKDQERQKKVVAGTTRNSQQLSFACPRNKACLTKAEVFCYL